MTLRSTFLAGALLGALALSPANAAGPPGPLGNNLDHAAPTAVPPREKWSFAGPLGKFDRAQLQRGYKVYREVCSSCHSMNLLTFRNLQERGGPEFTAGQVQALAAEYKIQDGPNDQGEMFERPRRSSDPLPAPYPNEQAARVANGGAYPPDQSVIAKARSYERGFPWFLIDIPTMYQEHGVDYITALLNGYDEPPQGMEMAAGQYYNHMIPGNRIAMPKVLNDGQVEYPKTADGKPQAPEEVLQYAKDVSAFLMWAAEPHLEERKRTGFVVMSFLAVFATLLWLLKRRLWGRLDAAPVPSPAE